jgi:methionyl-tRNA formyltransferase
MNILLATIKKLHAPYISELSDRFPQHQFVQASQKEDLLEQAALCQPDLILFPHWSWIIPPSIHEAFTCIVFHTADLPFGRGGSPIQNQIKRGIFDSYLCALRVSEKLDEGDIYIKQPVSLRGTADEVMLRIADIIFHRMIPDMISALPTPVPQKGEPVVFKRLSPSDSRVPDHFTMDELFHHIQMLDGEGYPAAYIESEQFKIEFSRASLKPGYILADAKITRKGDIS